jgi:hypothetical protein
LFIASFDLSLHNGATVFQFLSNAITLSFPKNQGGKTSNLLLHFAIKQQKVLMFAMISIYRQAFGQLNHNSFVDSSKTQEWFQMI